ncbi:MAG: hypothetical protein DHS20C21_02960 [Gemmatimonadota bacterium]|nr:MAG: hypothetical protein DHS20C21_02960 [Gemmatimonadota bacterium]
MIQDDELRVLSTKNPGNGAISMTVEHLPTGLSATGRGFSRDRLIARLSRRLSHRIQELGREARACAR